MSDKLLSDEMIRKSDSLASDKDASPSGNRVIRLFNEPPVISKAAAACAEIQSVMVQNYQGGVDSPVIIRSESTPVNKEEESELLRGSSIAKMNLSGLLKLEEEDQERKSLSNSSSD